MQARAWIWPATSRMRPIQNAAAPDLGAAAQASADWVGSARLHPSRLQCGTDDRLCFGLDCCKMLSALKALSIDLIDILGP